MTYRVNEIFHSLQGEGAFTGTPMVFVRMAGCNRACRFCDTDFKSFTPMSAAQITERVSAYRCPRVVLTGGEPMLQTDDELIDALHGAGLTIHMETNGTLPVPPGIDWVTCSPKEPPLGIQPERPDEIKIVYTGQSAHELQQIREAFPRTELFYLQPCSGQNIPQTVEMVMQLATWRLSLQIHKLINIQ